MTRHHRRESVVGWQAWLAALAGAGSLVALLTLGVATVAFAGVLAPLPDGVPNLFAQPGEWQTYQVGNAAGDPDFPLLMFVHQKDGQPAAVLMAVDAQNGKDRWSLASDPVIVIAILADPDTITQIYYDAGFVQKGKASGTYATADHADHDTLRELLDSLIKTRHQTIL